MFVCTKPYSYSKHVVVFYKTPINRSSIAPSILKCKLDTPPISSVLIADDTCSPSSRLLCSVRPPVLCSSESRLLQSVVETEDSVVDVVLARCGWNEVEEIGIVQSIWRVTDDDGTRDKNHNRLAIDRGLNVNRLGGVPDLSQTLDLLHDISSSPDLISLKGHHGLFVL